MDEQAMGSGTHGDGVVHEKCIAEVTGGPASKFSETTGARSMFSAKLP